MLGKIYFGLLAIALIVMGVLTFLCYSWLQSIGDPASIVENYNSYAGLSWTALWICFLALVILANILMWIDRKSWALWTSLLFFVTFIIVQTFWLDKSFFAFMKSNNFTESSYFLKPFLGVTVSAVAAIGIFFNQFIVLRMRDKMFTKDEEPEADEAVETHEES